MAPCQACGVSWQQGRHINSLNTDRKFRSCRTFLVTAAIGQQLHSENSARRERCAQPIKQRFGSVQINVGRGGCWRLQASGAMAGFEAAGIPHNSGVLAQILSKPRSGAGQRASRLSRRELMKVLGPVSGSSLETPSPRAITDAALSCSLMKLTVSPRYWRLQWHREKASRPAVPGGNAPHPDRAGGQRFRRTRKG